MIVIAGLFLGGATHIPIGVQFVTPALSSVSYFFGGGHSSTGMFVYYYVYEQQSPLEALKNALWETGIGWILDKLGVNVVQNAADALATITSMAGKLTAIEVIEAFSLAGVSAWIMWFIFPVAATIAVL